MEEKELEKEIKRIEVNDIRVERSPSVRMNNFYALATILIMSVVILWYSNYVFPQQEKIKQQERQEKEYKAQLLKQQKEREAQIELSQKLNSPKENLQK